MSDVRIGKCFPGVVVGGDVMSLPRAYHERGFVMDPSCKVYLPLYRSYPMNGLLVDESLYHNQFTVSGATRNEFLYATKDKEYVINGEFANTNNWTSVGLDSFTVVSSRARLADATPPGYITQTVTGLEVGKRYLFKVGVILGGPDYPVCFAELRQNDTAVISRTFSGGAPKTICNHFLSTATTAEIRLGIQSTTGAGQYGDFGCCSLREMTHFESAKGFWFDDIDDTIVGPQLSTFGMENQFTWIVWATRQSAATENETPFFSSFPYGSVYFTGGSGLSIYLTTTPSGAGASVAMFGLSFNLGAPYMYVFTHDSSLGQRAHLYAKNSVTRSSLQGRAEPMNFSTALLRFGISAWNASRGAIIHEVAMFNRTMSIPEIDNYYNITRRRYE